MHEPVLRDKVLELFSPLEGKVIVDATIGIGGHAEALARELGPNGQLIGLDRDASALEIARKRLRASHVRLSLFQANFSHLDEVLNQLGIKTVDGVLMDLGLSSLQLDSPERGFSFQRKGPLDMRMDQRQQFNAWEIVNRVSEARLGGLLREYGEERFSRQIAAAIVQQRKKSLINTTLELAELVGKAMPRKAWPQKIHPATRTFQALRVAVNEELQSLKEGIAKAVSYLSLGGRLIVLSYHSLEDRIVKNFFKESEEKGYRIVTKKPVVPLDLEIKQNPRSRSAKMRVLERAA